MTRVLTLRGGVIALALLCGAQTGGIRYDELVCEEALERTRECCPQAGPRFTCGEGCNDVQISEARAEMLRDASCEELRAAGGCVPVPSEDPQ